MGEKIILLDENAREIVIKSCDTWGNDGPGTVEGDKTFIQSLLEVDPQIRNEVLQIFQNRTNSTHQHAHDVLDFIEVNSSNDKKIYPTTLVFPFLQAILTRMDEITGLS